MKQFVLFLSIAVLAGCQENGGQVREGARQAVDAPADYVTANVRAQQQAQTQTAVTTVNNAVRMFQAAEGRNPQSLAELQQEGYLAAIPETPRGTTLNYNPQTGQVTVESR